MYDIDHLKQISKLGGIKGGEVAHKKRLKNIKLYNISPKLCKTCNARIEYDNRQNDFCSRSCAATFNNIGKRRHGKSPKKCIECGKLIPRAKNDACKNCEIIYRFKYCKPTQRTVRTYLIRTRSYKCEKCKLKEWLGKPIPLEAHHKDGNRHNNKEQNLELICPNCHVFTDTYKGKNNKSRRTYNVEVA